MSEEPEETLAELFAKDPLKLTRADRARIIEKFREKAALFFSGQKIPKDKKPAGPVDKTSFLDV